MYSGRGSFPEGAVLSLLNLCAPHQIRSFPGNGILGGSQVMGTWSIFDEKLLGKHLQGKLFGLSLL